MRLFLLLNLLLAAPVSYADTTAAPFGLAFGAERSSIGLKVLDRPRSDSEILGHSLDFMRDPFFGDMQERPKPKKELITRTEFDTLLDDCVQSFDRMTIQHLENDEVLDWAYGEVRNLPDFGPSKGVMERWEEAHPNKLATHFGEDDHRSAGIYVIELEGTSRPVCLVFTSRGLTQIYFRSRDLLEYAKKVRSRLELNPDFIKAHVTRRPVHDEGRTLIVRKTWRDSGRGLLYASKHREPDQSAWAYLPRFLTRAEAMDGGEDYFSFTDYRRRNSAIADFWPVADKAAIAAIEREEAASEAAARARKQADELSKKSEEKVLKTFD